MQSDLERLASQLKPVRSPEPAHPRDLVEDDLFEPGLPPVPFIDFSPSARPAGFAAAIVIADALV